MGYQYGGMLERGEGGDDKTEKKKKSRKDH